MTLDQLSTNCLNDNSDIQLISVCTVDGFNLSACTQPGVDVEADKIAAIASSLNSISNSSSQFLSQVDCSSTMIEAANSNILFVKSTYAGKGCVITFHAKSNMSIASLRFLMKRYSSEITKLSA